MSAQCLDLQLQPDDNIAIRSDILLDYWNYKTSKIKSLRKRNSVKVIFKIVNLTLYIRRRKYQHNEDDFWFQILISNKRFQITSLQVDYEKLLIESFSKI